ncbi:MAG: hypothetical protein JNM75_12530 [Rhodospirillales bacterium]|nr:hypothetical protein [Rhodospirillales bacterium]
MLPVAVAIFSAIVALSVPATAAPISCLRAPALVNPLQYIDKCPEDPDGPYDVNARGRDVLIRLPGNRACNSRLSVVNANNVRIMRGRFVMTDDKESVVSIGPGSGTTFIEGLDIDVNGKSADAIRFYRNTGVAIIQNTRMEGVSGTTAGTHGDITQPQGGGPLTQLILQNVSAYTGYQGLFTPYRPDQGHGTHKLTLQRVNLGYDPNIPPSEKPLILLFIGRSDDPVNLPPDQGTTLSDVYVDVSVWQKQLPGYGYYKSVLATPSRQPNGCATFAPEENITGEVCDGQPPEGDFAPQNLVGLKYRRDYLCTSS